MDLSRQARDLETPFIFERGFLFAKKKLVIYYWHMFISLAQKCGSRYDPKISGAAEN